MKKFILFAALAAIAGPASAREIIAGAGYANYNGGIAIDDAAFSLEYHHTPFFDGERFDFSFGVALSGDMEGNLHAGVGIVGTYALDDAWFVEASVMPGAFWEGISNNTLGSRFQIRSLVAVGYEFETGNKLSFAVTHKSNASTTDYNPGVDTVLVRYHVAF